MSKKTIVKEFRDFINKGNVVDMSVGIIVGSAFTSIVNSLVKDIISPLIGFITGSVDFSNWVIVLRKATEDAEEISIKFGSFINAVINFLIVAFVVFNMVKLLNVAKGKMEHIIEEQKEKIKSAKQDQCPEKLD